MKSYRIGDVIKRRRKALGMTQMQLCAGICDMSTLSKIETGRRVPFPKDTVRLLERLGLSSDIYYVLVGNEDFSLQNLELEIREHTIRKEFAEAIKLLDQIESHQTENPFVSQFILRQRSIVGYIKDGSVHSYTPAETLELLYKAISLTVPAFDIERIADQFLCTEELMVIVDIAVAYTEQQDYDTSGRIYARLIEYISQQCMSTEESSRIFPLIAYNYARDLEEIGDYSKAVEISEQGRKYCIKYGKTNLMGELLATQGCALYKQGSHAEGIRALQDACAMLRVMEKFEKHEFLKNYVRDTLCVLDF